MEVLVYLVLGLSVWILVPSERSALLGRVSERSAQDEGRPASHEDADETLPDGAPGPRDR